MPSKIENGKVESVLRGLLQKEGFTLSGQRRHGELGVDILAQKNNEEWYIECIGHKSSGPARAKDFYESFFRTISRLNENAKHIVIAMSNLAERGLPRRARQYRVAWERIAKAFPELEIWLVDTENNIYKKYSWLCWL